LRRWQWVLSSRPCSGSGTAISLHDNNDTRGLWHDGSDGPTCIGTDTTVKTHVRLGIIDVQAHQEGIGGPRVMWLRCLD
jgi:hypothetical protein